MSDAARVVTVFVLSVVVLLLARALWRLPGK